MAKKKVKASEVLKDINGGMTDATLMEKYGLSEKGLEILFGKLINAGLLKKSERDNRRSVEPKKVGEKKKEAAAKPKTEAKAVREEKKKAEEKEAIEKFVEQMADWECPACGKPQIKPYDQCPECGVDVQKFLVKRATETTNRELATVERKAVPSLTFRKFRRFLPVALILALLVCISGAVLFTALKEVSKPYEPPMKWDGGNSQTQRPTQPSQPDSDIPNALKEILIKHYTNSTPKIFVLPVTKTADKWIIGLAKSLNADVVKATKGIPTKEIINKISPQKMWCIRLKAKTKLGGRYETNQSALELANVFNGDEASQERRNDLRLSNENLDFVRESSGVFHLLVWETRSGMIKWNELSSFNFYSGSNKCPEDWDNVCPFGCKE